MIAEQLKLDGIERVSDHNADWLAWAVQEIERLARSFSSFTADDLRHSMVCSGRSQCHPNAIGAAFNAAARLQLIARIGYEPSHWPSAHNRVVSVWTRKNLK